MIGLDPNDFLKFVTAFIGCAGAPWLVQKVKGTLR
jgi:hypothetical protein